MKTFKDFKDEMLASLTEKIIEKLEIEKQSLANALFNDDSYDSENEEYISEVDTLTSLN